MFYQFTHTYTVSIQFISCFSFFRLRMEMVGLSVKKRTCVLMANEANCEFSH